jgi:nicotinic acid mononucleotide adenylyltransferase
MGADSFAALRRWHRAAEIPFAAALIVASRPGESLEDLEAALPVGLTIRQSLEKCLNLGEIPEEDSAGAKAHPLLSGVSGTTKVVPCYKTGLLSSDSVDSLSAEEKREIEGKIPRGLKPKASTDGILARLKSCPFKDQIQLRRYILRNPAGKQAPFYLLPNLEIEISASEIRRHIHAAGQSPLLPAPVLEYIRAHGLYRDLPRPN